MTFQSSDSNPLRINTVAFGPSGGLIGITFAPGKQQDYGMTASHRRNLGMDLDVIAAWNAAAVVTLIEPQELDTLGIRDLGAEVQRRHMAWHHWPIQDYQVPDEAFMAAWPGRSAMLRSLIGRGGRVLIHCKGGLGRAGSVVARLLVEAGEAPDAAIATVRAARPNAIETAAQAAWVAAGHSAPLPEPDQGRPALRDRAVGALLGLAVGDAVGAAIEFTRKPRFAVLDDMIAGGPHRLLRGQWTDDTAMALALADSLLADPGLDPSDLMARFLDWQDTGSYSCTGVCFDIGNQTSDALRQFRRTGEPMAGSDSPKASGNGALMRLAPVAIRHWQDRAALALVADVQTRTTHGSPATLEASREFATMLADAIAGADLTTILSGPVSDGIGWRGRHRDAVEGSGYVVLSLQAAVWAVARSTDFRSAVLLAANLGQDADTTAAVAGQLAGAVYGASGIPAEWLTTLAWRERLQDTAERLFDAGCPARPDADGHVTHWMTRDWGLRERLEALAAFRPVFEREGFISAETTPNHVEGAVTVLGGTALGEDALLFYQMLYDYGWVGMFDWTAWRQTAEGARLMCRPDATDSATAEDLMRILTTCVRADRFCDGYLEEAFSTGLITRVVVRAERLLRSS